jgi:integrase
MRLRESFSLYRRTVRSGKIIWYYQCYDANGIRLCGHSTGKSTKTAAKEFCLALAKEGRLIPADAPGGRCPTMAAYAKDFWNMEKSEYLKSRMGRGTITESYADSCESVTKLYILPVFGKRRLDTITQSDIDKWLTNHDSWEVNSKTKDGKEKKGVQAGTANKAFERLFTMMNWAVFKKLIRFNPCHGLKKLAVPKKKVDVLSFAEARSLFPADYTRVWENRTYYTLYKLACCTGMRISEILGLKGEYVYDNYILVHKQYNRYGYVDTKTHTSRNIPLPPSMINDLNWLKAINGNGFLFSDKGGVKPLEQNLVSEKLKEALEAIGISREEQKERKLTNHSFRYFLNTLLVNKNVNIKKIHAVTGHTNEPQTDPYTSVNALEFAEVLEVQETLLDTSGDEAIDECERVEFIA